MTDELRPIDAVKAMRARGVDNAEELLQYATLEAIRGACAWWDTKPGVGPGLLAKKIREGGIDPEPRPAPGSVTARLRATFESFAEQYPVGVAVGAHVALHRPRWPDEDPCPGSMVVVDLEYPVAGLTCDHCGFEMGLPARALARHVSGQDRSRTTESIS